MKKLFITLLSLCTMSAAVFAESDYPQGAMNIEGILLWKIQGGTMTIYGDDYQPMRNYSSMSDELRHFAGHEFQTIDMTKGITIGNYAFSGLKKLERVNLHGTSTGVNPIYYIGKNAFEGSSNLTSINSEALTDLRYIGERAFAGTAIKSFTVKKPAGGELMDYVQTANGFPVDLNLEHCYIGDEAFAGCRYLSTVYMNDATPFTGTYNGFLYEHTYLVVDNADVAATYRAAWESIADRIIYLQQNVTFSSEAFKEICVNKWDTNNDGELSYEEAFAVTTFGDAFKGNTELKEITINDLKPFVNVTVYESGLFEGCTNLEKITISPFVTDIADDAFKGCTSLKEIHFVTEIPFKENFTIETNERTHIIVPDAYLTTYDNTWTNKSELIIGESHIPFQCAIAKNMCVTKWGWDTNKDGELSYTEASKVTSFGYTNSGEFYGSDITSFDEFKFFTSLRGKNSFNYNYAFKDCKKLTSITLPEKFGVISEKMFSGCSSLSKITLPAGITKIEKGLWDWYNGYCNLYISDLEAWCKIDFNATLTNGAKINLYLNGELVKDVVIPNTITAIKDRTFAYFDNIESVSLHERVESIGNYAFSKCEHLTSFTITNNVTAIGSYSFNGCIGLTNVTIPMSVKSIGQYALNSTAVVNLNAIEPIANDNISDIAVYIVPESALEAYKNAWSSIANRIVGNGKAIWEVTCEARDNFPNLTEQIGEGNEQKIVRLRINGTINSYDMMVMRNKMINLRELDLTNARIVSNSYSVEEISASQNNVFSNFMAGKPLTNILLPESIEKIGENAFNGCAHIASITIPANATSIGNKAFYDCSVLKSVVIPEGSKLKEIGQYSFSFPGSTGIVTSLKNLDLSNANQLETIGKYAFYNSGITNIKLPESLKTIGENAFASCKALTEFTTTASIGNYAFNSCTALSSVTIKGGSFIDDYSFSYCSKLKTVTIEDGLTSIGASAFRSSGIESISLPSSLVSIEQNAFQDCRSLNNITLPSSLVSIGQNAFQNCSSLNNITLPSSLENLGTQVFLDCTSLEKVEFNLGITYVPNSTFKGCTSLKDVKLSPKTKEIRSYAFQNCTGLEEFHLPPYLTKIETDAFSGCTNINSIYAYMPDVPAIEASTFANYATSNLYAPAFLWGAYYIDNGWNKFLNVLKCNLRPGDYEAFYTNKDLYFKEGEERITLDRPIVELGNQGSIIVEGAEQEFTTVDMLRSTTSSSLIGDGNIVIDELRVKIEVAANRWYFLCFPYDVEIDGCEYPGKYAWRYYDGAVRAQNGSGGWKKIEGNKLTAGMGYIFQSNTAGNLIVKFSDPEFGGDRPVSLEAHNCTNAADASWNFVGNPYASYYNVEEEDFTSPITVWNGTTYVAYRPGDDDYHLQPYEAFFVQKTENDGAVNFEAERRETYTMSQATAAAKARASRERGITPERLIVNLTVSDNDTAVIDRTRLVMNAKASRNYETDCDASKFISDDAVAQIYTVEGTVKMAINERPGDGEVRLGYIASKKGTLRIEAQRMDVPMEIIDTETNTTHDLSEGAYVFTTKAGTFDKRFVIRTSRSATGIIGLTAATGVAIGMTDGGLTIGGAEGKTVGIHTVGGALVAEHNGNGHIALPGGTYVVTVDGYSTKVFVK